MRKTDITLSAILGLRGVENQHYIICHTREYGVWKINTVFSIMHVNAGGAEINALICVIHKGRQSSVEKQLCVIHHAR